jgi:hypothetical protein
MATTALLAAAATTTSKAATALAVKAATTPYWRQATAFKAAAKTIGSSAGMAGITLRAALRTSY